MTPSDRRHDPSHPLSGSGTEPDRVLTLYCLAHAGGSAMPYARWSAFLGPGVRVVPTDLPGHGTRLREPLIEELAPLVAELARTIRPRPGGRFALFGHSFGAVLAFELARRFTAAGTQPVALLVAGRNSPAEPLSRRPIHDLPDAELLAALGRYGGLPPVLLAEPELLRVYLPAIRADLRMEETYSRSAGPTLDAPVAAFAGRRDWLTDTQGLLGWERETTTEFDLTMLCGGHFFLSQPTFQAALAARLGRLSGAPEDRGPSGGMVGASLSDPTGAGSRR